VTWGTETVALALGELGEAQRQPRAKDEDDEEDAEKAKVRPLGLAGEAQHLIVKKAGQNIAAQI
jgi:hypothetical protein